MNTKKDSYLVIWINKIKNMLNEKDLVLLWENTFFEMLKNDKLKYSNNMLIKDIKWNVLNATEISIEEYFVKYYLNNENWEIEELVIVKDNEKAKEFHKRFKDTLDEKNNFELLKIDEKNISNILKKSFEIDQKMRGKWEKLDSKIDFENLKIAVSILENNMKYLLEKWKIEDFKAIFYIIQHSNLKFQKKYIEFFTKISEKWYLKKSDLALMIDRILMNEWKPQIYWTQYTKNKITWKLELYEIEDINKVNENRKTMNLRTIEEQNKHINIDF